MNEFANIPVGWLAGCRRNFGPPPRCFPFWHRWHWLYAPRPNWLQPGDPLALVWLNLRRVFEYGELCWGATLQANTLLFQPGKSPHPTEVIYPQESGVDGDPAYLRSVAKAVFRLKNTSQEDPLLKTLADYLTRETVRATAVAVPSAFATATPCVLSTIVVFRHHLPDQMLTHHQFPLVVLRDDPQVALILPSRFWPPAMIEWWLDG